MQVAGVKVLPSVRAGEYVQFSFYREDGKPNIAAYLLTAHGQKIPINPENLPREFRAIKDERQFHCFLHDAYPMPVPRDNGEIALHINQRGRGGGEGDSIIDPSDETDLAPKTLALVHQGLEELQKRQIRENTILFVGRTGAGKSTLCNVLSDVTIKGVQIGLDFKYDVVNPIFPISHSNIESCTTCPNTHTPENKDYTYIDFPGFDDTHGAPQDITNAFFRKRVLQNVKKLKIVLLVGYHDISKKGLNLVETFDDFVQFSGITFPQDVKKCKEVITNLVASLVLVISHAPSLDNSKVREANEKLLEEYLNSKSPLSPIGKKILTEILAKGKWTVFSAPNQAGIVSKAQPEKMQILGMIKGSAYLNKGDTDVQVKVSPKYSGKILTSLQYTITSLKKQFADRIVDEVTGFLQKFFTTVAEESALVKFQQRYQKVVSSTDPCTLSELLENLSFTVGMFNDRLVAEAKEQDETIRFLRELLPPKQAEQVPHQRDWIKEFDLLGRLQAWNDVLLRMVSPANLTVSSGRLLLQGYFPKTSQITQVIGNHQNIKEIEIHGLHTVTLDEDLTGPQFRGVNVTIISPKWTIVRNRQITLTGNDCAASYASRNTDGGSDGASGTDGNPGLPGGNAGHFFGVCVAISDSNQLKVFANGGKGGAGQNGGNGHIGANGADGVIKNDFCEKASDALNEGIAKSRGWDFVEWPPFHHHDNKYDMALRNNGKAGQPGGHAGKGGAGGKGGREGSTLFVSVLDSTIQIQTERVAGAKGTDGLSGTPGEGGTSGKDWGGCWSLGHRSGSEWSGHHKPNPRTSGGGVRAARGSEFSTDKNSSGIADPVALEAFDQFDHLFRYREFVIKESNPLVMQAVEIFRRAYDTNSAISQKASVASFVAECQKMEEFFTRMDDKTKCLPMYMWMIERIQLFEATLTTPNPTEIADLQCLYTLTLSKILQLRAAQESRLIIDIKGFLRSIDQNIDQLVALDHAVMVNVYETEYVGELNSKIAEADAYIKKLSDDIRAADRDLEAQMNTLLEEIKGLQASNAEKKGDILIKRQRLKELMDRRRTLGIITTAVQCIGCCFPPIGPVVAGVVSVGLTIASNWETAPTIGAQALATYTEGIADVLGDKTGKVKFSDVNHAALSRVRTLTLVNGVINALGAPGSSEEEQLKAMNKAIEDLDKQRGELEQFKDGLIKNFNPVLKQIVTGAADLQNALKGKTKIALDFSRLATKRAFDNIKNQIKACTQSFAAGEGFVNIIRQLEEAIDTTAKIYERIQDYEEKQRLVHYLARLAATGVQNPEIEKYKQKVQRNVVLEQYSRAVSAVRQWAFPYASLFLGDFVNLQQFVNTATIPDFMVQVKQQLRLLQNKVKTHFVQINSVTDTVVWTGKFAASEPNGPFYTWNYAEHGREIRDLFRGEPVFLFADVDRTSSAASAIKFNSIQLQITSNRPRIIAMLSEVLQGVRVEMRHSGLSYFRHEQKVYRMVNDNGFSIHYRFKDQGELPEEFNMVFQKMRKGAFMLSPYTQWLFKLSVPADFIKKISDEDLASVEVHLIGEGQYVYTEKAKGRNWELGQYESNVFLGDAGTVVPPTLSSAATSKGVLNPAMGDNAMLQKDNPEYLYQGTDVGFIVRSPTISRELENFHFIQGMQAEHLRRNIDRVMNLVNSGKTVLCIYNISNRHWVTFATFKQNANVVTLYKDSFGGDNEELLLLLKAKSSQFRVHPTSEQSGDATNCGILALENMRIIARELNGNRERFLANFETQAFCTLERARQLRQGDFATFYTQGVEEYGRLEAIRAAGALALREAHVKEVNEIVERLQASASQGVVGSRITIQSADATPDAVRTIVVQIGAENANLDDYHYRIQSTKDIPLEELQRFLMGSFFAWQEGLDYRIENGVIKVTRKIV